MPRALPNARALGGSVHVLQGLGRLRDHGLHRVLAVETVRRPVQAAHALSGQTEHHQPGEGQQEGGHFRAWACAGQQSDNGEKSLIPVVGIPLR